MAPYTMTIAGESIANTEQFDVIDPASGAPFASAPVASSDDVERAMESAQRAFVSWRSDEQARRQALARAAEAIRADADALAELLTREQGKPKKFALAEVKAAIGTFRYHAELPIPVDVTQRDESSRIEVRRRPYGVVAAITPWNFPLLIAASKTAAALLAGNTVVLKPSPFTPLSSLRLGTLLRSVMPPGVFNVLSGGDELGRSVAEHRAVGKISFTGSVATGKKVAHSAADDLKRVTLELGGNDPAIVLGDVDVQKTARSLFWGAFMNSGQVCTAIKRLYVHESVFKEVVAAVAAIARSTKVGSGLEADVDLGPINNRPQFERVEGLLRDSRARGARVHGEGARSGAGYFFEPTIVTDLPEDARLVCEEQFGPLLPILPFTDLDEVLARANATHFGLSGSVWTSDVERGAEIAARLECGTAWVNQHMVFSPKAPFGGSKWSGIGYENGPWGLEAFCQLQVLNIRNNAAPPSATSTTT
jgi:acyl-CoA reductase-like NAD-dependent aldehyde dehydrogenase